MGLMMGEKVSEKMGDMVSEDVEVIIGEGMSPVGYEGIKRRRRGFDCVSRTRCSAIVHRRVTPFVHRTGDRVDGFQHFNQCTMTPCSSDMQRNHSVDIASIHIGPLVEQGQYIGQRSFTSAPRLIRIIFEQNIVTAQFH